MLETDKRDPGCIVAIIILVLICAAGVTFVLQKFFTASYQFWYLVFGGLVILLALLIARLMRTDGNGVDSEMFRSKEIEGPRSKRQPKPKSDATEGR